MVVGQEAVVSPSLGLVAAIAGGGTNQERVGEFFCYITNLFDLSY